MCSLYLLEVPHWGNSVEQSQHLFSWRNKKALHVDTQSYMELWLSSSGIHNCDCSRTYKPVCGANGKTYPSACIARCVGQEDYQEGACRSIDPCETNPCQDGYRYRNCFFMYCNNWKYWDRQVWANNVDPDQMPHSAASDQALHCLPLIQHYFRHINRL